MALEEACVVNIVKKLNKRIRRVQLPKDEELFPELLMVQRRAGFGKNLKN